MTEISVIVPIYNSEPYLPACLDALKGQTVFDRMEILLIDDGSTDGSPAICDRYAARDAQFRVFHRENAGVSAARNFGLSQATGAYVGFSDSDDTMAPEMFERLLNAAKEKDADLVFCGFLFEGFGEQTEIRFPFEDGKVYDRGAIVRELCPYMLADSSLNSLCNKLMRGDLIRSNGITLTAGRKHGEDREFVLSYLLHCRNFCSLDFIGYYYRRVETSAVQRVRPTLLEEIWEQCRSDEIQFAALGVERRVFEEKKYPHMLRQIVGALELVIRKSKGVQRKRMLQMLLALPELNTFLLDHAEIVDRMPAYQQMILRMAERGDSAGIIKEIQRLIIKAKLVALRDWIWR